MSAAVCFTVTRHTMPGRRINRARGGGIDYDEFCEWCRMMSVHNRVLVSEYSMPDDFTCIWEQAVKTTLDNTHGRQSMQRVERLYTL